MLWLLVIALVALVLYKLLIEPLSYWKKRGVPHKTAYPFFGNFHRVMLRKTSFYESMIELYRDFPNLRYNGTIMFSQKSLLIRDLDLIKRIAVKDFDHFTDHKDVGSPDTDPLFSKNLVQLNGHEWKEMRSLLSPAFTGSKMKGMFSLISDCSKQMTDYFSSKSGGDVVEIELKDLFTRYANDVIATCAFGVKCDSLKDKENTFFMMGKEATQFTGLRSFKILLANFAPGLLKAFNVSIFPKYIGDFFLNAISETISYRQQHNVVRPDMIHLLLEARKGKLVHEDQKEVADEGFSVIEESSVGKQQVKIKELTDLDIAAQAFIFFFAGFDTSSTILSFMATEMAANPEIQAKLATEVDDVMANCGNKLTYEAVTGMKYLDMVVSETLRKWPAGPMTDRKCTKRFVIEPTAPGERTIVLEPEDNIMIPIVGIHRDEQYFHDPERFDPERFSDENKDNIQPFSYMPFGVGPRACIGSRFALLEIKVMFTHLLSKFELVPVKKTVLPIKLSRKNLRIQPEGGFWLGFKPRRS